MDDNLCLPGISKRSLEIEFVTVKCARDGQFCNTIDTCSNQRLRFKCVIRQGRRGKITGLAWLEAPDLPNSHRVSFCVDASDLDDPVASRLVESQSSHHLRHKAQDRLWCGL